jgi:hypothetical protein
MRKFIAIAAALGLLGATSLTPVFAQDTSAPADKSMAKPEKKTTKKSTKKHAKKHKKHAKKHAKKSSKKSKTPAKKPETNKSSGLIVYRVAA